MSKNQMPHNPLTDSDTPDNQLDEQMQKDLNTPIIPVKPEILKAVEKETERTIRRGGKPANMRYAGISEWDLHKDEKKNNHSNQGFQSFDVGGLKNNAYAEGEATPLHDSDEGFKSFTENLQATAAAATAAAEEATRKHDALFNDGDTEETSETAEVDAITAAAEPEPNLPPEPSVSEEMLQTLHDGAYTKGFHDGRNVAIQSFEKEKEGIRQKIYEDLYANDSNDLLHKLGRNIYQHVELVQETERDRDVHLLTLMLEVFRKILPGMVTRYGTLEIEHFLKEIMELTRDDEPLEITLPKHDDLNLTEKVAYILRGKFKSDNDMDRFVKIHEDEKLSLSDCRIAWKNGMATRNFDGIWADIERILSRHMWLALPEGALKDNIDDTSPTSVESPEIPTEAVETQADSSENTADITPNITKDADESSENMLDEDKTSPQTS